MTNYSAMEQESKKIAIEQQESRSEALSSYIAIVSDRYEQEMNKAVSNIKSEGIIMSNYNEFKAKYNKIRNLSYIEDPEPWLEYPSLIEEMLDTILRYELEMGKIENKALSELKNKGK